MSHESSEKIDEPEGTSGSPMNVSKTGVEMMAGTRIQPPQRQGPWKRQMEVQWQEGLVSKDQQRKRRRIEVTTERRFSEAVYIEVRAPRTVA